MVTCIRLLGGNNGAERMDGRRQQHTSVVEKPWVADCMMCMGNLEKSA